MNNQSGVAKRSNALTVVFARLRLLGARIRTGLVVALYVPVALMAGCGGGGGGSSSAPPAPPSIQSFSPSSGLPNSSIIVVGTTLAGVSAASVGATSATVSNVTASQVTVTVPAGATSGPIALTGTGISLQSSTSFTVSPEPTITTTAAQGAGFGGTFMIAGTNLTEVKTFSVGGTALSVVSVSDTSVSLTAPSTALTGKLTLTDTAGNQIATSLALTAFDPTVVTAGSFSPTSVAPGNTITVSGTALTNVSSVAFYDVTDIDTATGQYPAGASPSLLVAPATKTATSLTVIVPEFADSGGFNLLDSTGKIVGSSGSTTFTVVKPILADWVRTRPTATGLTIYIHGAHLDQVTSANVGTLSATLGPQSLDTLQLTAPASVGNSAPIVLNSSTQAAVAAGATSVVGSGLSLNALEFAQVHSQQATDPRLRLTAGRPVLVRATVTADTAQKPSAQLIAAVGSTTLGTVTMSPTPFVLPTNSTVYDSGALDTAQDAAYSLPGTFYAVLPSGWVQTGLTVQVSVTPDPTVSPGAAPLAISATPAVGLPAAIDLVLVPLQMGGFSPIVPTTSQVQSTLAAAYPYPIGNINVSVHAPVVVPSNTLTAITDFADLQTLLNFLEGLRHTEGSASTYYGFYSTNALSQAAQFAGLASRNSATGSAAGWLMSAVGYDRTTVGARDGDPFNFFTLGDWQELMIHELGHVHSRAHTGCYDTGATPPQMINFNFPYDFTGGGTGAVGFPPLYFSLNTDTTLGALAGPYSPGTNLMTDVMGYCTSRGSTFFSTYNYFGVQQFAEVHNQSFPASVLPGSGTVQRIRTATVSPKGYITLSGEITSDGVRFFPAGAHSARPVVSQKDGDALVPTTYQVQIHTAAGTVISSPIYPVPLADTPRPTKSFFLTIENPGPIDSVTVLRAGVALAEQSVATKATPQPGNSLRSAEQTRPPSAALVVYSFEGGKLTVQWSAASEPFLSATRVSPNGIRAVLASQLKDGTAVVDVSQLSAGDVIELGLSSTHSARMLILRRPAGTSGRGTLR